MARGGDRWRIRNWLTDENCVFPRIVTAMATPHYASRLVDTGNSILDSRVTIFYASWHVGRLKICSDSKAKTTTYGNYLPILWLRSPSDTRPLSGVWSGTRGVITGLRKERLLHDDRRLHIRRPRFSHPRAQKGTSLVAPDAQRECLSGRKKNEITRSSTLNVLSGSVLADPKSFYLKIRRFLKIPQKPSPFGYRYRERHFPR